MSLSEQGKQKVREQIEDCACPACNTSGDFGVDDHGLPEAANEWGVSGAYVRCEACGYELHKEA